MKKEKDAITLDKLKTKLFNATESFDAVTKSRTHYRIVSKPNKYKEPELYKAWYRYHAG
jgi:hypothetical protein